ncbi:MAG: allantoinase AllB [Thermaerobacter sp.]|nr:allantoinase AllB [Thermaerobacter sp.]
MTKQARIHIINAQLVTPEAEFTGHMTIHEGRIVSLREKYPSLDTGEVVDVQGDYVFPAMIDAHVHFNEPGRTHWEGFEYGSRAALAGGVGMVCDMPLNSSPPTVTPEAFGQKLSCVRQSSRTQFGLWAGIIGPDPDAWQALWALGAIGFKFFMADSGLEEFPPIDDDTMKQALNFSARTGALLAVHAEDAVCMAHNQAPLVGREWTASDYLAVHAPTVESVAVDRLLFWARRLGGRVHIVHASLAGTVEQAIASRQLGVDVSVETCPHYLTYTDQDFERRGALLKCAPPLRSRQEVDRLWECVAQGQIDWIASDHSPSPPSLKTDLNMANVWGGVSGVQSTVEVVLAEGHYKRNLPMPLLAKLLGYNVARRLGLGPRGALLPGYWADLAVIGCQLPRRLNRAEMYDRHQHNPYQDVFLPCQVHETWIKGQRAYQNGTWSSCAVDWVAGPGRV